MVSTTTWINYLTPFILSFICILQRWMQKSFDVAGSKEAIGIAVTRDNWKLCWRIEDNSSKLVRRSGSDLSIGITFASSMRLIEFILFSEYWDTCADKAMFDHTFERNNSNYLLRWCFCGLWNPASSVSCWFDLKHYTQIPSSRYFNINSASYSLSS